MTAAIDFYIVLCVIASVLFISLLCVGVAVLGTRNERMYSQEDEE